MDSKFEVFYFPLQVRAEPIRLLLSYVKANWDNKPVGDWGKEKFGTKGLLYKQVPMLIETTASGKENRLVETGSIMRYLANVFNLTSNDKFEAALLDSYYEGQTEVNYKIISTVFGRANDFDNATKDLANDEFIKNFLSYQEEILAANGSNGHYLGDKTTYADINGFFLVDTYMNYPNLNKLFNKENIPNLYKVYENLAKNPELVAYKKSDKRFICAPFHPVK